MGLIFKITTSMEFEAAHFLPMVPEGHKCRRLHGHSYRVEVTVKNFLDDKQGWVMDLDELNHKLERIIRQLDHQNLNEIGEAACHPVKKSPRCLLVNPTVENIARFIFNSFSRKAGDFICLGLSVTVHEGNCGSATYEGYSG